MGKIKQEYTDQKEEDTRMDLEFKDYQIRKNRLKKKNPANDFKPELDDDFFGFDVQIKTSKLEKLGLVIVVLWVLYFSFQAILFITRPVIMPVSTSTEEVDYSNLKPIPERNWNFTPINQR